MIAEELKVMCAIDKHPNVLALIGGVTANIRKGQLLIVTEYIDGGELRELLIKCKSTFINELFEEEETLNNGYMVQNSVMKKKYKSERIPPDTDEQLLDPNNLNSLSTSDLCSFALQIANGMEFLASVPCVHRDLACRNILVTKTKVVRVADFGLAKKHLNKTYYRLKVTKDVQIPVRWMAPESLENYMYTQKSDVWSFGICLYEIFSLGNLPYANILDNHVVDHIMQGHRNPQPKYCHGAIYKLMKLCWQHSPTERPSFSECVQYLKCHINTNSAEVLSRVNRMLHMESEKQEKFKDWILKSGPENLVPPRT
uniref:Protein kinase domain-containing protein n=1 Tax=Caenorhabditis tropicalis TaxID=1561998 RepID=A0A1I7TZ56_9PELO